MGPPNKRDEDWFTRLYAAEYEHMVRYGLRRLADRDLSVELAQEVFVVAWRRRADVPERSLPWLYGVARRLLANQWRSRRRVPDLLSITGVDLERLAGSSGADTTVGVADIRAALATLNDLDQEILRLVGWEELTVSEAAGVLGCTGATAAVRLHRARRRLAEAMSDRPVPTRRSPLLATIREDL
ncbi:RNA polymerase sigma factor [Micromonospora sp. NPDC003944]